MTMPSTMPTDTAAEMGRLRGRYEDHARAKEALEDEMADAFMRAAQRRVLTREIAAALGVSRPTLYRWVERAAKRRQAA